MKLKLTVAIASIALSIGVGASSAFAAPPPTTDGFVCPVLGGRGGANAYDAGHGPFMQIGGGDLTVIGPSVTVPVHATNQNGAGQPGGAHAHPGEENYTAIWAGP